ncbi:MAG: NUDIX domain-containing protein [Armatimonadetes bacterium]|nr:NUDIX domain-containing protein [Armatimonadota bacterium]
MKFPSGRYGRQSLEFHPAPFRAPLRAFAALVFPWCEDKVLICNIEDRGWCIPSGRVEPDESSLEAAVREAREEAGAILQDVLYLGCYRITERGEVRWADVYAARVTDLVDIPEGSESLGRQMLSPNELPEIYHLWNPLTEAVFKHSHEILKRHAAALGLLRDKGA